MNIVVLCGGLSNERDVSLSSGFNVAKALSDWGHNAVMVDLYLGYTKPYSDPREIFDRPFDEEYIRVAETAPDLEMIAGMRNQDNDSVIADNVVELCRAADMTFLALHGDIGENGKLQAMFDIAGIKYTGSGYVGSILAMNKRLSKAMFREAGILTPEDIIVRRGMADYKNIGFPCMVKPCSGGSSVGTSVAHNEKEYADALELAFEYEDEVLVERYIKGRELTVGVVDGKPMPVIEIIPKEGFYDYKNKYQAGRTIELCPAPIDEDVQRRVQDLAVRTHYALMIDAYSRADFIMDDKGELYCIETNTLPGMTPTSLIPQMAAAMGMSFGRLCEIIIEVSEEKYK